MCDVVGLGPAAHYIVVGVDLNDRNLQGTIPDSISQLNRLQYFDVPTNKVNGTIPITFGSLTEMTHFGLSRNLMTGSIPISLRNLTELRHFAVDGNYFTGTIPNKLFRNYTRLNSAIFSNNLFTGTFPSEFGTMLDLVYLYFNRNHLSGKLPVNLSNLTKLAYLDFDSNKLTGTIPEDFARLDRLHFLGLHNNALTGTIPSFLNDFSKLQFVYLNNNHFSGCLPHLMGGLSRLLFFHAQYNDLTGTIPASFGQLHKLQYLYLNNNGLTGSVPAALSNLTNLQSILLQDNDLSGNLYNFVNPAKQLTLTTIQLSNNRFSGTLPDEVFHLANLTTLVAVSNCFHGSLPAAVCDNQRLFTLVLDSLRSNSRCSDFQIPGFTSSADKSKVFNGKIPLCLFQHPALNTLHLSGNGLSGILPDSLEVSGRLLDLSLSHNVLSGKIPANIQNRFWYNLDLSYNRFSGELDESFYERDRNLTFYFVVEGLTANYTEDPAHAALDLTNNRLSGRIPNSVSGMNNISILTANLFQCSLDKKSVPANDNQKRTYTCGSTSFDIPFYIWLVLFSVVLLVVATCWYWRKRFDSALGLTELVNNCKKWCKVLTKANGQTDEVNRKLGNIQYVNDIINAILKVTLVLILVIVVVCLPMYTSLSYYYGTYLHQYSYSISADFLSGEVPFVLQFILYTFLMLLLCACAWYESRRLHPPVVKNLQRSALSQSARLTPVGRHSVPKILTDRDMLFERFLVRFAFFIISVTVVLGVNIAFVYVALYEDSQVLFVAQILLSLFKVLWNIVCAPFLIRWTSNYLSSAGNHKVSSSNFFQLQVFVSLFNNIVIPALVVAVIEPSCFYNVLVPAKAESSHYVYAVCDKYAYQGCLKLTPQIATESYEPMFRYSYQCSSSFITYYAPAFVYVAFVASFVTPVVQFIALRVHAILPRGTYVFRVLDFCLPPVLKPVSLNSNETVRRNVFKPYFDSNLVLVTLLTYLGIMLTFGAVFPTLGVTLAGSIVSVVYFSKLKIGRLITQVIDTKQFVILDIIEKECAAVGTLAQLRDSLCMVVGFSCAFYMLFLFDTLGDSNGFDAAFWVIFVVPLFPVVVFVTIWCCRRYPTLQKFCCCFPGACDDMFSPRAIGAAADVNCSVSGSRGSEDAVATAEGVEMKAFNVQNSGGSDVSEASSSVWGGPDTAAAGRGRGGGGGRGVRFITSDSVGKPGTDGIAGTCSQQDMNSDALVVELSHVVNNLEEANGGDHEVISRLHASRV
jgi:Leucine-rich repeat (LRR) protein